MNKNFTLSKMLMLGTAMVPFLYLMGYFYNRGYLLVFELDNQYFVKNTQQYLVDAFVCIIVFANYFILTVWKNFGTILMLIVAVCIFGGITKKNEDSINTIKEKIINNKWYNWFMPHLLFAWFSLFGIVAILYILVIAILVPLAAEQYGQNVASKNKEVFANKYEFHPQQIQCVLLKKDNKVKISGMFVAVSDNYIALWDKKTYMISFSDVSDIETIPCNELE